MSSTTERQVRVTISGRVQGVGFRAFARNQARRLGVGGSVRNLPQSRVEVVALAEPLALDEFLALLSRGPQLAHVDRIHVEECPAQFFADFYIRY